MSRQTAYEYSKECYSSMRDLQALLAERKEIELKYSKDMHDFSEKLQDFFKAVEARPFPKPPKSTNVTGQETKPVDKGLV